MHATAVMLDRAAGSSLRLDANLQHHEPAPDGLGDVPVKWALLATVAIARRAASRAADRPG